MTEVEGIGGNMDEEAWVKVWFGISSVGFGVCTVMNILFEHRYLRPLFLKEKSVTEFLDPKESGNCLIRGILKSRSESYFRSTMSLDLVIVDEQRQVRLEINEKTEFIGAEDLKLPRELYPRNFDWEESSTGSLSSETLEILKAAYRHSVCVDGTCTAAKGNKLVVVVNSMTLSEQKILEKAAPGLILQLIGGGIALYCGWKLGLISTMKNIGLVFLAGILVNIGAILAKSWSSVRKNTLIKQEIHRLDKLKKERRKRNRAFPKMWIERERRYMSPYCHPIDLLFEV